MDPWYLENLVCPHDKTSLTLENSSQGSALVSSAGRRYPVIDGIPVMLADDMEHTHDVAARSLARAKGESAGDNRAPHLYLESLGISNAEKAGIVESLQQEDAAHIDPVVSYLVGATSGFTYKDLIGNLEEYPIPELRLSDANDTPLLDIGCGWGRWSIAAARKGYATTGIDPSLGSVMAARRVAKQLGLSIRFVVGDARYLPFKDECFGAVFSYSVLQHFSKDNVRVVLDEVERVLQPEGQSLIQMPNWLGVRSLYHQARRRFREPQRFDVRYWSIPELTQTFGEAIGPSSTSVDCYFGLGLQKSDQHLMSGKVWWAIEISERLRTLSHRFRGLKYVADSVYVRSTKENSTGSGGHKPATPGKGTAR